MEPRISFNRSGWGVPQLRMADGALEIIEIYLPMENIDLLTHSIAKTTCPRLTHVLTRDRLLNLLSGEETRPVKWIQGPPGSGKSTLAADYVNTFQPEHIWYRVDETDANISAFFYNLK